MPMFDFVIVLKRFAMWLWENTTHFPSIGSDDPPPLGVENVKIRENSEKTGDPRSSFRDPLQPFQGP